MQRGCHSPLSQLEGRGCVVGVILGNPTGATDPRDFTAASSGLKLTISSPSA